MQRKGQRSSTRNHPRAPQERNPPNNRTKPKTRTALPKTRPRPRPRGAYPHGKMLLFFILGACRLYLRRPTKAKEREKPHPAAPRPTPRNATRWGRRDPYIPTRLGKPMRTRCRYSPRALCRPTCTPRTPKETPPSPQTKTKSLDGRGVPAAANKITS